MLAREYQLRAARQADTRALDLFLVARSWENRAACERYRRAMACGAMDTLHFIWSDYPDVPATEEAQA